MKRVALERLESLIYRDLALAITTGLRDPRVAGLGSITKVKLTGDLKHAKVYVSCLGDEGTQRTFMKGLNSARGHLQRLVAKHLRTRQTPQLHFEYDEGIERSVRLSSLINDALAEDREAQLARGELVEEDELEDEDDEDDEDDDLDADVEEIKEASDAGPAAEDDASASDSVSTVA